MSSEGLGRPHDGSNSTPTQLFSIVLPVFNAQDTIMRAVNSVIDQDTDDWELIIVDDASTDGTAALLAALSQPRIRVLTNTTNLERSATRNRGIGSARGTYVCFLDSDDFYLPHHLSVLQRHIEDGAQPVQMFFTLGFAEVESGEWVEREFPSSAMTHPKEHIVGKSPIKTDGVCIHHRILEEVRFDQRLLRSQDTDLYLRIADRFALVAIGEHTFVYMKRWSTSYFYGEAARRNYQERLRSLRWRDTGLRRSPHAPRKDIRAMRSDAHFGLANIDWVAGRRRTAAKHAVLALWSSPTNRPRESAAIIVDFLSRGRRPPRIDQGAHGSESQSS